MAETYYEWHCEPDKVMRVIEAYVGKEWGDRALDVGCGTSQLAHLLRRRVANVLAIDNAKPLITQGRAANRTSGLAFEVMDVRRLDALSDDAFDIVVDKGCIDAVFCGYDTYNGVLQAHGAICRVLRVGGRFFEVTHGAPPSRLPHLKHPTLPWTVEHTRLGVGIHVYVCTKTAVVDDTSITPPSNQSGHVSIAEVRDYASLLAR